MGVHVHVVMVYVVMFHCVMFHCGIRTIVESKIHHRNIVKNVYGISRNYCRNHKYNFIVYFKRVSADVEDILSKYLYVKTWAVLENEFVLQRDERINCCPNHIEILAPNKTAFVFASRYLLKIFATSAEIP